MSKHNTYNFTLVLEGLSSIDGTVADALHESGCDDALLSMRGRIPYLEFHRRASSFRSAVLSAIKCVERTGIGASVVRLEPGDAVSASEIARRLSKTRECIRLWIEGKRRGVDFPVPVTGITQKAMIWSWSEVVERLYKGETIKNKQMVKRAIDTRDINDALDVRRDKARIRRQEDLLEALEQKA